MVFVTLNRLNQQRQEAEVKYYERTLPQVTEDCIQVIYIADMSASIAGLIAARLSNDLFKPVLCVCNRDPKNLSGSFRSPVLSGKRREAIGMNVTLHP